MFSNRALYSISIFIKGTLMGIANKIPGVSGGALAYVLGFYNQLIYSLQKINKKAILLLINFRFKSFYSYINGHFLLCILGGCLFSYFTVSKLLDFFLINNELEVWSLFFGMIIGSGIHLIKKYENWELKSFVFLVFGVLTGIMITFINPGTENENLWFVFLCGIISVSGMAIPGLSGSYILMLMGNYVFLLIDAVNVLNDVLRGLFVGDTSLFSSDIHRKYLIVIMIFSLGSLMGLIFLSQILSYVLNRWKKIINALIIGFILGSLGTVWPWKEKIYDDKNQIVINFKKYFPDISSEKTQIACLFILIGILLVLSIDFFSKKKLTSQS